MKSLLSVLALVPLFASCAESDTRDFNNLESLGGYDPQAHVISSSDGSVLNYAYLGNLADDGTMVKPYLYFDYYSGLLHSISVRGTAEASDPIRGYVSQETADNVQAYVLEEFSRDSVDPNAP